MHYVSEYRQKMNDFRDQLWNQLYIIPTLDLNLQRVVLFYLIELACQSQNDINIQIGREALLSLPRQWLLSHIEGVVELINKSEDEWEYRRLLELYWLLDKKLVKRFALQGLKSENPDVVEAAEEFINKLN